MGQQSVGQQSVDQQSVERSPKPWVGSSVFAAIGRWVYRYRWLILALWAVLLVLGGVFAPRLDGVLHGTGTTFEAGEAAQTDRILEDRLAIDADALTVVFEYPENGSRPAIEPLLGELEALPTVETVAPAAALPGGDADRVDDRLISLGLGIAISVFIDSTLIRAVLVPSSMSIMGHWNWWCPFVKRQSFSG